MIYSKAAILALAAQCAPNVAPRTVAAIVMTESRGDTLAVNGNGAQRPHPSHTAAEAGAVARRYIAAGYSVDLGLGQINSRNMRRLGLAWDTVFDPCTNIAALGRVLTGSYETAAVGRDPQAALRIAFSLYNTGSRSRGFRNGYVDRVVGNAGLPDWPRPELPILAEAVTTRRTPIVAENILSPSVVAARDEAPPAWNLFARADYARRSALPPITIRSTSVWSD